LDDLRACSEDDDVRRDAKRHGDEQQNAECKIKS
jgi:hypothetical protein